MRNSPIVLAAMLALSGCSQKQYDFNRDGHPDRVETSPSMGIFVNWGATGGYTAPDFVLQGTGYSIRDIGDFNGDGHLDIKYCNYPPIRVPVCIEGTLLNNGDGTFRKQTEQKL